MRHLDPWAVAWLILKALFGAWALAVAVAVCATPLDSLPGWAVALLVAPGLLAMLLHAVAWWTDSSISRTTSTPRSQPDE